MGDREISLPKLNYKSWKIWRRNIFVKLTQSQGMFSLFIIEQGNSIPKEAQSFIIRYFQGQKYQWKTLWHNP